MCRCLPSKDGVLSVTVLLSQRGVDTGVQQTHSEEENVDLREQQMYLEEQKLSVSAGSLHDTCSHPQPDVVRVVLPGWQEALVSDVRVSERSPWASLRLKGYGSVWNHLSGELTGEEKATLDQGAWQAEQVKRVYKEIMSTLPRDHLRFDAVSDASWAVVAPESCL